MLDQTYHILLVEDSPSEILLFKEAVQAWTRPVCLYIARDAPEALEFLDQPGRTHLDLMILNIHLPGMSGLELLRQIRQREELNSTPAVVLSSSADPAETREALENGASSYHTKPLDFDAYCRIVAHIETCCRR
jgi:CheY-like chemotaxis protein